MSLSSCLFVGVKDPLTSHLSSLPREVLEIAEFGGRAQYKTCRRYAASASKNLQALQELPSVANLLCLVVS